MPAPFLTPISGRGRPDYSMSIQRSVSPTSILQSQIGLTVTATLPSLVYPFVYPFIVGIKYPSGEIPAGYPIIGYNVTVTGDTNADSVAGVQIYEDTDYYTDVIGTLFDTVFIKYAPKVAELHASRGFNIEKYAGKYLVVLFAHYSANPMTTMTLSVHGLIDIALSEQSLFKQTVGGGVNF